MAVVALPLLWQATAAVADWLVHPLPGSTVMAQSLLGEVGHAGCRVRT
jgi:hypothetical protein